MKNNLRSLTGDCIIINYFQSIHEYPSKYKWCRIRKVCHILGSCCHFILHTNVSDCMNLKLCHNYCREYRFIVVSLPFAVLRSLSLPNSFTFTEHHPLSLPILRWRGVFCNFPLFSSIFLLKSLVLGNTDEIFALVAFWLTSWGHTIGQYPI